MPVTKIMIIRHAEKPADDGSISGVSQAGLQDPEELAVRGWQRSGALVRLFAPPMGSFASMLLATPDIIFASGAGKHSRSLRSQHTVLALADFLGKRLDLSYEKGEENLLAADALQENGNVLIAWEHEAIPEIANQITGGKAIYPRTWRGTVLILYGYLIEFPLKTSGVSNRFRKCCCRETIVVLFRSHKGEIQAFPLK